MTIVLTITDGTVTVNLSGTDGITEEYVPQPPEPGDEAVVETLGITLIGGNSAVDTTLAKLERLLQQARDHQEKTHETLPIYFKVEIDGIVWRSELYDGKPMQTADWIKGERAVGTRRASLILKRSPWWEKETQVAVYLTNGNGTNQQTLNGPVRDDLGPDDTGPATNGRPVDRQGLDGGP